MKPGTPREKDYIEALGAFYDAWEQRNHTARAYRDAMEGVHERNPKDQEAAIFYALAWRLRRMTRRMTISGKPRRSLSPCSRRVPNHPERGSRGRATGCYVQQGLNT